MTKLTAKYVYSRNPSQLTSVREGKTHTIASAQEAKNSQNVALQEQVRTRILKGARNISDIL